MTRTEHKALGTPGEWRIDKHANRVYTCVVCGMPCLIRLSRTGTVYYRHKVKP